MASVEAFLRARGDIAENQDDNVLEIYEDEVDAVTLFSALGTQWHWLVNAFTGERHRIALNYGVMHSVAVMIDIRLSPALFADIQLMEGEALKAFAEGAR